jgi:2-amino-4-hydroxy-6-hydroxymethyldihydropteridine diphosphokinase
MKSQSAHAAVLIGSNIQPEVYLPLAVELLKKSVWLEALSSAWETPAVGSKGPNFLNAVGVFIAQRRMDELKADVLRPIEAQLGRVRSADKFAPRTLDLDLIMWEDQIIEEDVWRYAHIAVPLAEALGFVPTRLPVQKLRHISQTFLQTSSIQRRADVLDGGELNALGDVLLRQGEKGFQRHGARVLVVPQT